MSSSEVPEPWATRMTDRGFTRRGGGPNVSALARAIGVSVETARRAVKGIGTPDPETVAALVGQLGADVEEWTGQHVAGGPYVPPTESALLTGPQRDALTDLIRAIAAGQRQRVGGEHGSASRTQAGHVPANDATPDRAGVTNDVDNNVHPLTPPDQGIPLDTSGWAARPGVPDNMPDDTTGEESQVGPEDDEQA